MKASGVKGNSCDQLDDVIPLLFDHYNDCDCSEATCTICGCRVRQWGAALLNKIRMGTERCPKGKW